MVVRTYLGKVENEQTDVLKEMLNRADLNPISRSIIAQELNIRKEYDNCDEIHF